MPFLADAAIRGDEPSVECRPRDGEADVVADRGERAQAVLVRVFVGFVDPPVLPVRCRDGVYGAVVQRLVERFEDLAHRLLLIVPVEHVDVDVIRAESSQAGGEFVAHHVGEVLVRQYALGRQPAFGDDGDIVS